MSNNVVQINRSDLVWAASRGLIAEEQVGELWNNLVARQQHGASALPGLSSSHVSYFLGAGVVAMGMAWLLGMAWANEWGGWAVFGIASTYTAAFGYAGHWLWFQKQQRIPGGLLVSIACCVVPIAVYGFQYMAGLWYRPPGDDGNGYDPFSYDTTLKELLNVLPMEISFLVAASGTLFVMPFSLLAGMLVALPFYMITDWMASFLEGRASDRWLNWVAMIYGAVCVVLAFCVERHQQKRRKEREDEQANRSNGTATTTTTQQPENRSDMAFWIYIVGAALFWFGLMTIFSDSEIFMFDEFVVNVALVVLSVVLKRRIFTVLGTFGIFYYMIHLNDLFGSWVLFPFVITGVGVAIIAFGTVRNRVIGDEMSQLLMQSNDASSQEQSTTTTGGGGNSNELALRSLEEGQQQETRRGTQ